MPTTIKLKNGSGAPLAGNLVQGEPALDLTNKRLYTEDSGGTVIEVGTNPTEITTGTITASGDVAVDTDTLFVDVSEDRVGINTSTPITPLTVNSTAEASIIAWDSTSTRYCGIGTDGTDAYLTAGSQGTSNEVDLVFKTTTNGVEAEKARLSNTGAFNVDGTVTADGLTVDNGGGSTLILENSTSTNYVGDGTELQGSIQFKNSDLSGDGDHIGAKIESYVTNSTGSGDLQFYTGRSDSDLAKRLEISRLGDISFYEDTGTTAKFFWDASAESLGIGTTSPEGNLQVVGPSNTSSTVQISSSTSGYAPILNFDGVVGALADNILGVVSASWDTHTNEVAAILFESGSDTVNKDDGLISFWTSDAGSVLDERMRIDSSGNVGIGTSSPSDTSGYGRALDIQSTTGAAIYLRDSDAPTTDYGVVAYDSSIDSLTLGSVTASTGRIRFISAGSEAMRIDSSGNVGIGESNPDSLLQLTGDTATITIEDNSAYSADSVTSRIYFNGKDSAGANRDLANIAVSQHAGGSGTGSIDFQTRIAGTVASRMTIDSSGNVGIGTSSPLTTLDVKNATNEHIVVSGSSSYGNNAIVAVSDIGGEVGLGLGGSEIEFYTGVTERMRIDSGGNLLVTQGGTNVTPGVGDTDTGVTIAASNAIFASRAQATGNSSATIFANRNTTDGGIIALYQNGNEIGTIGVDNGDMYLGTGSHGLAFRDGSQDIRPYAESTGLDTNGVTDLGTSGGRFREIYATNGTINTSDKNEKQDIEELSEAEQRVAVAAKGLLRKFRWKDMVAEKGDDARIHFGIMAQDLQAAFEAEGLDAGRYSMFVKETYYELLTDVPAVEAQDAVYETQTDEEGNETQVLVSEAVEARDAYTRRRVYKAHEEIPEGAQAVTTYGVRYSELLAFIIAAI